MKNTEIAIELPKGYYVKIDNAIGANYYDDKDNIILQHPFDSIAARKLVWNIYGELTTRLVD